MDIDLGTGAFWALAMIIYVQHLQIRFKSAGTCSREKASCSLPYKIYEKNSAESAFRDAH